MARVCELDKAAYGELVAHVWPFLEHAVRSSRAMGPLARSEDHVRDVMTALCEKIEPEGGTALGLYPAWRAANPGRTFEDWLRIVAAFTARDHVRRTLGRATRARDPDEPSPKRLLNEFVASPAADDPALAARPAFTAAQTARQMLAWAERRLPRDQLAALLLWMEGADFDEIGEELAGGDVEAARRLLRAGVAALRRQFKEAAG